LEQLKILVVEDDPDQLIIRCLLLSHHGYETRRAGDAATALRIAKEDQPDVAVVDLRLPTEEIGTALIHELKARRPTLTIIVLTGRDPESLRHIPDLAIADEILQKGNSSVALLDCLAKAKVSLEK
jgi:DNA-binding response OmpR family regulator